MNCKEAQEHLLSQLTGETNGSASLQEHLTGCAACRKERKELEAVILRLPRTPRRPPAYWDAYTRAVLDRIRGKQANKPSLSWRWALAAGLATAVLSTAAVYRGAKQKKKMEEIITHMDAIENLDLLEREDFEALSGHGKS